MGFLKPNKFKVILTIILFILLLITVQSIKSRQDSLFGISYQEYMEPQYYTCCERGNVTGFQAESCTRDSLDTQEGCTYVKEKLAEYDELARESRIVEMIQFSIFYLVSLIIFYLFSCVVHMIYSKIKKRKQ
ncbi:hypothetical protein GOV09_02160 [Candidatus Woesearchaeota archaeon]|nr:hypothetical protein [Candidatus Woesearchaeota archaeon]